MTGSSLRIRPAVAGGIVALCLLMGCDRVSKTEEPARAPAAAAEIQSVVVEIPLKDLPQRSEVAQAGGGVRCRVEPIYCTRTIPQVGRPPITERYICGWRTVECRPG